MSEAAPAPAGMRGVGETRDRLLSAVTPLSGSELVPLADALGRVVAEAVAAMIDLPPFDNSAMDGYALARRLQGREPLFPTPVLVPAGFDRPRAIAREEFLRVHLEGERIVPYPQQGSGVLSSTTRSEGLAVVPAGATVHRGDGVAYLAYTELLA